MTVLLCTVDVFRIVQLPLQGMGHSSDPDEIAAVRKFLVKAFNLE